MISHILILDSKSLASLLLPAEVIIYAKVKAVV
jgi:hypothetical protein